MHYRRANLSGATYFFTVNLAERKRTLLIDEIEHLKTAVQVVKTKHPFKMDAIVILPDHFGPPNLKRQMKILGNNLMLGFASSAQPTKFNRYHSASATPIVKNRRC